MKCIKLLHAVIAADFANINGELISLDGAIKDDAKVLLAALVAGETKHEALRRVDNPYRIVLQGRQVAISLLGLLKCRDDAEGAGELSRVFRVFDNGAGETDFVDVTFCSLWALNGDEQIDAVLSLANEAMVLQNTYGVNGESILIKRAAWQDAVASNKTQLGYWEYVAQGG